MINKEKYSLKSDIDECLKAHNLSQFGWTNWVVNIYTDQYFDKDLEICFKELLLSRGEIQGGEKVDENTDFNNIIRLEEIHLSDIIKFILNDMLVFPHMRNDCSDILPQINGCKKLQNIFFRYCMDGATLKAYASNTPLGYCAGSLFAVVNEESGEIVVIAIEAND